VLLLDEPATGLDPQARHVVWDRLFRLKQQGVTLVLTTHHAATLIRSFTLGSVGWINLVNATYLSGLGLAGIWLARRRMAGMLLT
jgi:predicted ATPase